MDATQLLSTLDEHLWPFLGLPTGSRIARFDGGLLVASGVPVPDFNIGVITDSVKATAAARSIAADLQAHDTEAIVLAPSDAIDGARAGFEGTDVIEAGTAPLMLTEIDTKEGAPADPAVRLLVDGEGAVWGSTMTDAFDLPAEPCQTIGAAIVGHTSDRIYGLWDEALRSSVWCSGTNPTRGIWAMGTPTAHQRKGYGARLLAEVMRREAADGATTLFLVATEQGEPLYRRVGFSTLDDVGVWVRGKSPEFAT